jgi:single-strand DNA-binding protein
MTPIINFTARLGRDAEVKTTQNGSSFVGFTCATDAFVNGKTETMWFNVVDYSDRTLKIAQYLNKGKLVNICGEYTDRLYLNKNNEQQISRDIKCLKIDFVSNGQNSDSETSSSEAKQTTNQTQQISQPQQSSAPFPSMAAAMPSVNIDSDDLPF